MYLLALETSSEFCSVALATEEDCLSREAAAGQNHSSLLLPMIDALLAEAGVAREQLTGIAFGAGPGSFTGVRIACAVAQGMGLGLGLPLFPVATLEAMAELSGHNRVIAALDARLDEIYAAVYQRGGEGWECLLAPCLTSLEALPLPEGSGWAGLGSAFAMRDGALARRLSAHLSWSTAAVHPEAEGVARLARVLAKRGAGVDAADAHPLYLRDKVALTVAERSAQRR